MALLETDEDLLMTDDLPYLHYRATCPCRVCKGIRGRIVINGDIHLSVGNVDDELAASRQLLAPLLAARPPLVGIKYIVDLSKDVADHRVRFVTIARDRYRAGIKIDEAEERILREASIIKSDQ